MYNYFKRNILICILLEDYPKLKLTSTNWSSLHTGSRLQYVDY